ncbi:hypothetical protein [Bradyrhizobium valentinum]|uniref:hypothetical protein n=1 Tax=Bradyrhizobium valentinum TaxID=1518501 RepID=UPI0012E3565D|nr:hypothetical protein [Bradyrhizobium valentinum]
MQLLSLLSNSDPTTRDFWNTAYASIRPAGTLMQPTRLILRRRRNVRRLGRCIGRAHERDSIRSSAELEEILSEMFRARLRFQTEILANLGAMPSSGQSTAKEAGRRVRLHVHIYQGALSTKTAWSFSFRVRFIFESIELPASDMEALCESAALN